MEAVEFCGITFRSALHLHHFIRMIIVLGASIAWLFLAIYRRHYEESVAGFVAWLCFFGVLSFVASMKAISITKWGVLNGPMWSVDCIWFNALLGTIYFSCAGMYIWVRRHYKKTGRHLFAR